MGRILNGSQQRRISFKWVSPDSTGNFVVLWNSDWVSCSDDSPDLGKSAGGPDSRTCSSYTPQPIHIGTGNKYLKESDYVARRGVALQRSYNYLGDSQTSLLTGSRTDIVSFGNRWRSNYFRNLILVNSSFATISRVTAVRADGRSIYFTQASEQTAWTGDADTVDRLNELRDGSGAHTGWQLIDGQTETTETYSVAGKLIGLTDAFGHTQAFTYDIQDRLIAVTDGYGRRLQFHYDVLNRVASVATPAGSLFYTYDAANNLSTVTYPDGKVKTYLYNEPPYTGGANLPNALTGITDENGVRYVNYSYDSSGRAIDEVFPAVGSNTNHYALSFGSNSTLVTDPLNTARTYSFQTILGVVKSTGSSQPGGAGCGPASSALTYDANGNVATRADFNGNVTSYTYDLTRNLETQRIEASGKPEARTTNTQWHSVWRLPIKIAEPKKLTTYIYNGDLDNGSPVTCAPASAVIPMGSLSQPIGVLCKQSEQATTDSTGAQGFNATPSGLPRTVTTTYTQYGQRLTADGPRTDVSDLTTSTYYAADDPDLGQRGNLATVTNALGQVTRISAYDLNGNPLTVIDANGLTTTLTYDPRQRLTSRQVGSELATYQYDGVGQLLKATLPDGSFITYTWDAAHRLTDISDALGNSIHYTLDAMGNHHGANEVVGQQIGSDFLVNHQRGLCAQDVHPHFGLDGR